MRKPSGVQRRLRFPTPCATPPASREQRGSGRICSSVHEVRSGRLLSRASPGWGCENLPTVPAPPLAPPQPRGRPAPWPCPRRPVVRAPPRTAPLRGCPAHPLRTAGLPSGPRGSAPPPRGSRPPVAPGPARRVPWATVSRETGPRPRHRHPVRSPPVRASAGSQCPPTAHAPPRHAPPSAGLCPPGEIRGPGARGVWRRRRVPGADRTPLGRPRQRAALAL